MTRLLIILTILFCLTSNVVWSDPGFRDLKPGEVHTVKFNVENPSNQTSSGSASFNVSPSSFGKYLNKIGCFCFEKQTLKPKEKQEFVLTFFLDPKVVDDNKTKDLSDVTLPFTFFASDFYEKDKI